MFDKGESSMVHLNAYFIVATKCNKRFGDNPVLLAEDLH